MGFTPKMHIDSMSRSDASVLSRLFPECHRRIKIVQCSNDAIRWDSMTESASLPMVSPTGTPVCSPSVNI